MRFWASSLLLLALSSAVRAAPDAFEELSERMSLARHGNVIVATSASAETADAYARRFSAYDAEIRARYFSSLDDRPIRFIVDEDASRLDRLGAEPAAEQGEPTVEPSAYYHRQDRIVVVSAAHDDAAVRRELTRALLHADNPDAPHWFETAMASLYESSNVHGSALTPVLDDRMARIAADEDLDYDVFAGICDCYQITPEQLALMRLLLVFLHERGQLTKLYEVIEDKGRYVTLLEALDAMSFDGEAWRRYAEENVQAFWKSRDGGS